MPSNSFIQVPPDSTGKRLHAQQHSIDAIDVQVQAFHIADSKNPLNLQSVDIRGQAAVRFAEGSPTMDAFGNLRVASQYSLGAYEHSVSANSDLWTEAVANGGTVEYNTNASEITIGVTSASGSSASRTTNRYHFYQPGVSNNIILTGGCSDIGKVGNIRRWGYFDENNGVFFELNGTQLAVVVRSSASGSVVESRTIRTNWSDKLDGTGLSGMNIDITKANFWWIDYAWLGVGVVRFGVLAQDGSRWVVHTEENPNKNIGAYMQTGCLPIRVENVNTAITSGSSEFKLICSAVFAASKPEYTFYRHDITMPTSKSVTTNTPLLSLKPALTFAGKTNRVGLYPESISVFVTGGAVSLSIFDDGELTGATFATQHETALHDFSATAFTPSPDGAYRTWLLSPGTHNIDITSIYELNDEGYHVLADASDAHVMTLAASKLETTASVYAVVNYREFR